MITRVAITSRVVLPVPPEQAWRAVVDWPRQGQWMLATRVRGGQGAGAQVVARTGIGPLGFTDTMVITHWEPPRRAGALSVAEPVGLLLHTSPRPLHATVDLVPCR
jgi:uncharacterized protein YndB with AHSA1/START domain